MLYTNNKKDKKTYRCEHLLTDFTPTKGFAVTDTKLKTSLQTNCNELRVPTISTAMISAPTHHESINFFERTTVALWWLSPHQGLKWGSNRAHLLKYCPIHSSAPCLSTHRYL